MDGLNRHQVLSFWKVVLQRAVGQFARFQTDPLPVSVLFRDGFHGERTGSTRMSTPSRACSSPRDFGRAIDFWQPDRLVRSALAALRPATEVAITVSVRGVGA